MKQLVGGFFLSSFLRSILIGLLSLLVAGLAAAQEEAKLALPASGVAKVGFIVSKDTTLIDVAGPMAVFDQVPDPAPNRGFQTYTVSESRAPIKAGTLTIVPDYTFADAPDFDIIVEPAQRGNSGPYLDYIRRMTQRARAEVVDPEDGPVWRWERAIGPSAEVRCTNSVLMSPPTSQRRSRPLRERL